MFRERVAVAFLAGLVAGCSGSISDAEDAALGTSETGSGVVDAGIADSVVDGGPGPDASPNEQATYDVYSRLRPTCVFCHDQGWPRPLFADFDAFNNLLVWATNADGERLYVKPGEPENSRLVALLDKSEGNYFMPVDTAFIDLEAAGETAITLQEIRDWISTLDNGPPTSPSDASAPVDGVVVRRLTARQLVAAAHAVLGLNESDFWSYTPIYGWYDVVKNDSPEKFPVRSPDATPDIQGNSYDFKPAAEGRWGSLGGGDLSNGRPSNVEISPTFLQHWTQTSQAWCRMAVKKPGNPVLGPLSLADGTAASESQISEQIRRLHLRILGAKASESEVDGLVDEVFKVYESFSGAEAAWTAVCSVLLRDPRFITY